MLHVPRHRTKGKMGRVSALLCLYSDVIVISFQHFSNVFLKLSVLLFATLCDDTSRSFVVDLIPERGMSNVDNINSPLTDTIESDLRKI